MKIPHHLLDKYNRPVPRYTSYPPANFFHEDFGEQDFLKAMLASNQQEPQNVSLYIHIPFCNKICHYCGCNSMKMRGPEYVKRYMEAIRAELAIFRRYIAPGRKVSQVHWGGGTPNALPADEIERVMEQLHRDFEFASNAEVAIECNPAGLTNEYIDSLDRSGFNRISLGIQDFSRKVLDAVNREAPDREVEEIIRYIRTKDIKVNLDFIYGLPYQNPESFIDTIQRAINAKPDRLVTFSYAHVPWVKPAQKVLEKHGLPGPEEKTQMFESAADLLHEAGYRSIGLDHYARENDELYISLINKRLHRNFQGYCTLETTGQVYAAGISSISQLHAAYSQNTKNINSYIESLAKNRLPIEKGYLLSEEEIIIREVINELMCNFYLDVDKLSKRLGRETSEIFQITGFNKDEVRKFEEDGLLILSGNIMDIKDYGKFFIRNIAAAFDPLQRVESGKKFSRSV